MDSFDENGLPVLCDILTDRDPALRVIAGSYGYPPFWSRPNTFETLVHIILEQQVSLASAAATLEKLKQKVGVITPENVRKLADEEFREATLSRQKTAYVKHLSEQLIDRHIDLESLASLENERIRHILTQLKGIGNWTVDIYLIMVLHRIDIFPFGDLAAVNALKAVKGTQGASEAVQQAAQGWAPYRTIATMLLWHYYLSIRKKPEAVPPR